MCCLCGVRWKGSRFYMQLVTRPLPGERTAEDGAAVAENEEMAEEGGRMGEDEEMGEEAFFAGNQGLPTSPTM